jgi:uncharacterized protein YecE (DUF72 family)
VGKLLHGTSSWSEKAWIGTFYPARIAPAEMLPEYARHFPTVEADVTYYRIPDARMVDNWARRTPEGFVLSAKFPRSIVHAGQGALPDRDTLLQLDRVWDDAERFLAVMARLGARCGPLVLQFPYFNRRVFPDREEFLERLDRFLERLPAGFRYGVELRNRAWIDERLLNLLRRHGVALVLVDLSYMPHPADLARRIDPVTADFTYARLIGDRKAVERLTSRLDHIVIDRSDRLDRWAALLRRLLPRVETAYVYANNHYAGFAPATIRELVRRLEQPPKDADSRG